MLDSIYDCQNTKVCAAVSAISDVGHGISTDFEKASDFLLPTNPVTKKINMRKIVVISKVIGIHSGVGTSGVRLHWH